MPAHQILIYLNDGTGHFGTPLTVVVTGTGSVGVNALLSGDVNEDGKQDLIASGLGGQQADFVLLGNGDGTFAPAQAVAGSFGFFGVRLIDINGDKHLDIVSGGGAGVQAFLGDGKGSFSAAPAIAAPSLMSSTTGLVGFATGLAAGDFTNDGRLDVAVGFANFSNPYFYFGNGDGSFQSPSAVGQNDVGTFGVQLDTADFNGDGKLDLLVGDAVIVNIFNGHGDGTFTTGNATAVTLDLPSVPDPNPNPQPVLVAAADMDGDKHPDVVAADDNNYLLSVFLNDGTGTFPQHTPDFQAALDPGSGSVSTGDLNGDGLPDVVVTNYLTQKIAIFLSVRPKASPTVTVTSSAAQALVGTNITINVQVSATEQQIPTGTVTLTGGTTSLGSATLDAKGNAAIVLSSLSAGQYALTASYSGDQHNNSSTNATAFTQDITDFQAGLSPATVTVATGSSATYTVMLTPVAAFSGNVTLSCSGLPATFACPPVTTAVNGKPTSAMLVVTPPTVAATAASLESRDKQGLATALAMLGFGALA